MISASKLLKAIRRNCIECCAGEVSEVSKCTMKNCALFPYRTGRQVVVKKAEREDKK